MWKCIIMPRVNHFLKAWVLKEILYIAPKPLIFGWSFRDASFPTALWPIKKWQNIPNLSTYKHIWAVLSQKGEWDDWPLQVLIKSDWLIFKTASNLNDILYLNEIWITFHIWMKSEFCDSSSIWYRNLKKVPLC